MMHNDVGTGTFCLKLLTCFLSCLKFKAFEKEKEKFVLKLLSILRIQISKILNTDPNYRPLIRIHNTGSYKNMTFLKITVYRSHIRQKRKRLRKSGPINLGPSTIGNRYL